MQSIYIYYYWRATSLVAHAVILIYRMAVKKHWGCTSFGSVGAPSTLNIFSGTYLRNISGTSLTKSHEFLKTCFDGSSCSTFEVSVEILVGIHNNNWAENKKIADRLKSERRLNSSSISSVCQEPHRNLNRRQMKSIDDWRSYRYLSRKKSVFQTPVYWHGPKQKWYQVLICFDGMPTGFGDIFSYNEIAGWKSTLQIGSVFNYWYIYVDPCPVRYLLPRCLAHHAGASYL